MNLKHTLQTIGLSAIALGVPVAASCQTYQFSAPISGWLGVDFTDRPSGLNATEPHMNFTTLTETLYLDLKAHTLRQVGSISLSQPSQTYVIHESQATVTFNTGPVGGAISFDTGAQPLSAVSGGYILSANIGDIHMTGSYSVAVNGGGTYTGPLNFTMHQTVDSAWAFQQVLTGGYPNSLTLQGLGNYGGVAYYHDEDLLATITDPSGFSTQLVSGAYVVPGYGLGNDFQWSIGTITALAVPEPASLSLLGFGLLGLLCWRRR